MTTSIALSYNERREAFLASLPDSYVPAIEAQRFVAELRATDPAALAEHLDAHAESIVTNEFARLRAVDRQRIARSAGARRFSEAAEAGEIDRSVWAITFRVDEDNTQKRLGAMTGADHNFVASSHEADSKREALLASFHRAVAKKVGRRTTEDVFTPEKFMALRESITGEAA